MRKLDLIMVDDVSHRTLISSRQEAELSGARYQNADARRVTINPRGRREVAFTQRLSTGGVSFLFYTRKEKSQRHLSIMFSQFNDFHCLMQNGCSIFSLHILRFLP